MSSIQVVFYDPPWSLSPQLEQRLYYFHRGFDPPVVETNTFTIGTFRPAALFVNRQMFQRHDFGPPVVETNTFFIAKFGPVNYFINRQLFARDLDIEPPVVETNVHFLAKFQPANLTVLRALRENPHEPDELEPQSYFASNLNARFTPVHYVVLQQLRQNPDEPQAGLGFGKRRPLLLQTIGGVPGSYWPNGGS